MATRISIHTDDRNSLGLRTWILDFVFHCYSSTGKASNFLSVLDGPSIEAQHESSSWRNHPFYRRQPANVLHTVEVEVVSDCPVDVIKGSDTSRLGSECSSSRRWCVEWVGMRCDRESLRCLAIAVANLAAESPTADRRALLEQYLETFRPIASRQPSDSNAKTGRRRSQQPCIAPRPSHGGAVDRPPSPE